jgi:hypothetical protein
MDGSADRVEESSPPSDAVNRDRIVYQIILLVPFRIVGLPPTQHRLLGQAVDEG